MKKDCKVCGIAFVVPDRRKSAKFCSRDCFYYSIKKKQEEQQQDKAGIGLSEIALLIAIMALMGLFMIMIHN